MRMRTSSWILVWLGLTVAVMPFDQCVHMWSWSNPRGVVRDVLTANDYLSGYPVHLLFVSILLSQVNRKRLVAGYLAAMVGQGLVVDLIKVMVGRGRPLLGKGAYFFQPFAYPDEEMTSFPSGDAAAAMALATLLGIYFPKSRWLFWLLALSAAIARVARSRHFISDVVFGAGVGVIVAMFVVRWLGQSYFVFGPQKDRPLSFPTPGNNWGTISSPEVVFLREPR